MVRALGLWFVGVLLALVLAAFFFSLVAAQLTSTGTGQRIQRRAVVALTDIDSLLPTIEQQLHQSAMASNESMVRVPEFPVVVDLPRDQALSLGGQNLRNRLLDEASRRLYSDGMSAWTGADPEAQQNVSRLSTAGAVHRSLGLVRHRWHTLFVVSAVFFGIVSLVLAAGLMIGLPSGFARLLALGAAVSAAAIPSLAAAVALRFALRTAASDADAFEHRLLDLGVDTMWLPIRDYLAISVIGVIAMGLGGLGLWLQSRGRGPQTYSAGQPGTLNEP